MILDLPEPIAIACHDAGAANIILSWLGREAPDILPVMQGPAMHLWRARFPGRRTISSLAEALSGARSMLSGTGWASDLEHCARQLARATNVVSVAVVDHWTNYVERFERGGEQILPDAIWVTDNYAEEIARRTFSDLSVVLKPNLYLEEQARRARLARPRDQVLYVSEPVRSDWGRDRPGEFQALDWFLAHRGAIGIASNVPIRLRPHPSDAPGKYDAWIAAAEAPVSLDNLPDLAREIGDSRWVVGCQSFALVIALAAGRTAVSVLPPWAPPCALPHHGLVHLRDLVA